MKKDKKQVSIGKYPTFIVSPDVYKEIVKAAEEIVAENKARRRRKWRYVLAITVIMILAVTEIVAITLFIDMLKYHGTDTKALELLLPIAVGISFVYWPKKLIRKIRMK